jgi:hypothetical protein
MKSATPRVRLSLYAIQRSRQPSQAADTTSTKAHERSTARVQYLPTARAPGRHSWAELFTLVGAIRRIASDRDPAAVEAMGRIRDAFAEYEENRAGDRGNE